jgi:hypothetical protein
VVRAWRHDETNAVTWFESDRVSAGSLKLSFLLDVWNSGQSMMNGLLDTGFEIGTLLSQKCFH